MIAQLMFHRKRWNKMVEGSRPLGCDEGSNDQVLDPWVQIIPLVPLPTCV
jgi:hypothetical protein